MFVAIKIEKIVDAQAMGGGYEAIDGYIGLQGPGGAEADDIEGSEGGLDLAGIEVDIGEGIEFVDDDIDIIGADAGGEDGEAFLADEAGMGDELAVLGPDLDGIEVFADLLYAVGIADGDDGAGNLLGAKIEVIDGATGVDDQFRFGDAAHIACLA